MALTIYSMGDLPIFTSVLNAVAMVFNSSMYDPFQGAGVFVMGLLLGILFLAITGATTGKLNWTPLIFAILLFYAGIVPRETLQVEDMYSGQITTVANIPLVVALPGSLAASLSKAISDNVETAFQTTSGSYLAMGTEGFVNPLKLMLSLRDQNKVQRSFPYLTQSITEFIKYCAPTDLAFSGKAMAASSDIVSYLTGLNVLGVMTYWNVANPQGIGVSCANGQTFLTNDTQPANMQADAENLMKVGTAGNYAVNPASLGPTAAGVTQAYNSVTAGIMGNMQTAQQFMVNAVAMGAAKQGIDCINQPTGPNMAACMSEVMTREALEKQNIDAAAQASVFTTTLISSMNILLALFYAFSPIVLAIAFFAGPHGIKMVLGFLMFGVWTQSWMPIAAVINYIIQLQTQYAFSSFPPTGMTMENYMQFYSILTMKIGTASMLMAMTPVISIGLLQGSMMGLSAIAQGMNAKNYTDETKVAPSVGKNADVVQTSAWVQGKVPVTAGNSTGSGVGVDSVNNNVFDPLGNVSIANGLNKQRDHAKTNDRQARKTLDENLSADFSKENNKVLQTEYKDGVNRAVQATNSKAAAWAQNKAWRNSKADSLSIDDKELLQASLGLHAMGMGASASKMLSTSKNHKLLTEIANSDEFRNEEKDAFSDSSNRDFAKNLKTTLGTTLKKGNHDKLSLALASSETAAETFKESEASVNSAGARQDYNMTALGGNAESRLGIGTAGNIIDGAVPEEDKARYEQELKAVNMDLKSAGMTGMAGTSSGARLLALSRVNPQAFLKAMQKTGLAHSSSMSEMPSGTDVAEMNKPLQQNVAGVAAEATGQLGKNGEKVKFQTGQAESLTGSGGAYTKLVDGYAETANKNIEESRNQNSLGTNNMKEKKKEQALKDPQAELIKLGQQNAILNDNGDIAGFRNLADAADQWGKFTDDYPEAAVALSMAPMGRLYSAASALNKARAAAQAPALAAREAAKNAEINMLQKSEALASMNKTGAMYPAGGKTKAIAEQSKAVAEYAHLSKEAKIAEDAAKIALKGDSVVKAESAYRLAQGTAVGTGAAIIIPIVTNQDDDSNNKK